MKFNWSHILIAGMAAFIIYIVSMGVKAYQNNEQLYEKDYYEKGEDYAKRMEESKVALDITISYDHGLNGLKVDYKGKDGSIEKVKCFKLSNAEEDKIVKLKDPSAQEFGIELTEGLWSLEVYGEVGGEKFFKKLQVSR